MAHSAPYIAIHITSYHVIRWATKKGEIHFKEEIVGWTIENPTVSRLSQELVDRENVHEGLMVGDVNAGFVLRKVIMALDLHLRSSFLEWRDFREKMHWFFPRTPIEPAHSRKWGSLTPSTCGVCVVMLEARGSEHTPLGREQTKKRHTLYKSLQYIIDSDSPLEEEKNRKKLPKQTKAHQMISTVNVLTYPPWTRKAAPLSQDSAPNSCPEKPWAPGRRGRWSSLPMRKSPNPPDGIKMIKGVGLRVFRITAATPSPSLFRIDSYPWGLISTRFPWKQNHLDISRYICPKRIGWFPICNNITDADTIWL